MVLSKRERYILAVAVLVVGIFVVDRYVAEPLLDRWSRMRMQKEKAVRDLENAEVLLSRRERLRDEWTDVLASSLRGKPSEVESRLLHALRDCSQESGLTLASLKPERVKLRDAPGTMNVSAVGRGTMKDVARFVWLLETAQTPLKVEEITVSSRKEGKNDLSVQLRLSALQLAEVTDADVPAPAVSKAPGAEP